MREVSDVASKDVMIGTKRVGRGEPTIVCVVGSPTPMETAQLAVKAGAHIVEFRLDSYEDLAQGLGDLRRLRNDEPGLPVLLTMRQQSGEGRRLFSNDERRMCFREALRGRLADAIDLEADSKALHDLIEEAHAVSVRVVISHHNFKSAEKETDLLAKGRRAWKLGADVVKLAYRADTVEEVAVGLWFVHHESGSQPGPIAVIPMGEAGQVARITAPLLGSALTYGFVGAKPWAPGQLHVEQIVRGLEALRKKLPDLRPPSAVYLERQLAGVS